MCEVLYRCHIFVFLILVICLSPFFSLILVGDCQFYFFQRAKLLVLSSLLKFKTFILKWVQSWNKFTFDLEVSSDLQKSARVVHRSHVACDSGSLIFHASPHLSFSLHLGNIWSHFRPGRSLCSSLHLNTSACILGKVFSYVTHTVSKFRKFTPTESLTSASGPCPSSVPRLQCQLWFRAKCGIPFRRHARHVSWTWTRS